jgi:hypothetical protein
VAEIREGSGVDFHKRAIINLVLRYLMLHAGFR